VPDGSTEEHLSNQRSEDARRQSQPRCRSYLHLAPISSRALGALHDTDPSSKAPFNCVWTKQISHTLAFLLAFLEGKTGSIRRTYSLSAYLCEGTRVSVKLDASPWGLGAILLLDGSPHSWFSSPLTAEDSELFGHEIGDCSGQQTWECLVVLVALQLWKDEWQHLRAHLEVRADSVASLTMALSMKAAGRGPGIVARELALLLGDAEFRPSVLSHIPGVANVSADALSRRHEPGKKFSLPPCLRTVREASPPVRCRAYYLTLEPPKAVQLRSARETS